MARQAVKLTPKTIESAIRSLEKDWREWLNPAKSEVAPSKKSPNPAKEERKAPPKKKKLSDGDCLTLVLTIGVGQKKVNARWEFYRKKGKTLAKDCTVGLGSFPQVTLAEARAKRDEIAAMLSAGLDPKEERARAREERAKAALEERRKATSFSAVAEQYIRANEANWSLKNPMRASKTRGLVRNHIGPVFDGKPIGEIDFNDAVRLVQSIAEKGLSRSLLRKCVDLCKEVFKQAQADALRDAEASYPFNMAGPYSVKALPIIQGMEPEQHFAALAPEDAPAFFAELCLRDPSVSRDALIFAMLTTLRVNAVTGAKWSAIDWDEPMLVVPAGAGRGTRKIKNGEPYNAYLSSYAVAFLKSRSFGAFSEYVFTANGNSPVTREAVRNVISGMNKTRRAEGLKEWRDYEMPLDKKGQYPEVVTHGVSRATFKTWAAEDTHGNDERFNPVAVELVIDHSPEKAKGGRVQIAYDRSKLKFRRLEIVEAWGRYLITGKYPDEPDGEPCEGWKKIIGAD